MGPDGDRRGEAFGDMCRHARVDETAVRIADRHAGGKGRRGKRELLAHGGIDEIGRGDVGKENFSTTEEWMKLERPPESSIAVS
jgi:hypothetical protein